MPRKKIIHVNQHVIKLNKKHKTTAPVLTVKDYQNTVYANTVTIEGPSQVVYRPHNPLSCGAHCWIETKAKVHCSSLLKNGEELITILP
ncbi:MAG: hypothetical protein EBU46_00670 [Nitrosomonadaceae bacterium]|nr:hypothetical protein [Nitrosomonadaceae bacterium]